MIEIKDEHIKEAEILLIGGQVFDKIERIPFIKNLDSLDLLAGPGSGKTTALLAKLYCLSKHLPFDNGSGILVLSHTNAAVDEIEKHLKPISPKLFAFPNFIGTVQSFVNTHLANQACFERYGSYIRKNDDGVINELIARKIFYNKQSKVYGLFHAQIKNKFNNISNWYLKVKGTEISTELISKYYSLKIIDKNYSLQSVRDNYSIINTNLNQIEKQTIFDFNSFLKSCSESIKEFLNLVIEIRYSETDKCFYSDKFPKTWHKKLSFITESGKELKAIYDNIREEGYLTFTNSFELANYYLATFPQIVDILQSRFRFVMIDEMQDLEKIQIDLIDQIFYSENSTTAIQRIGDINQSIYNSGKKVRDEVDWQPRKQMYLNDSNRLTQEVSKIVNCFALDQQKDENGKPRFVLNGLRKIEKPIKPHLILFNMDTIGKLEGAFSNLINKLSLDKLPEAKQYGFKIIGWNAKWEDDGNSNNLRLENIFSRYKKEAYTNKETFDSLTKYIQTFDKTKRAFAPARKAILNAFVTVMRLEGKTYIITVRGKKRQRHYSKNEIINEIKSREESADYEILKLKLYEWSFNLVCEGKFEEVYNSVKQFIQNELKEWFDLTINPDTTKFIGQSFVNIMNDIPNNEEPPKTNIKIDIGTVHSAKGKTHCATMYVETCYHDYESRKLLVVEKRATKTKAVIFLPNPLLGNIHKYRDEKDMFAKQTLKMMYVGFSRPTHLLCFAALKKNIGEHIQSYIESGWEIIDLSIV